MTLRLCVVAGVLVGALGAVQGDALLLVLAGGVVLVGVLASARRRN